MPHLSYFSACPSGITVNSSVGLCGRSVVYGSESVSDNCPFPLSGLINGLSSSSFYPVGLTENTFAAMDTAGNEATCVMNVNVVDFEPPVIVCPSSLSVGTEQNTCSSNVTFTNPVSSDNCPNFQTSRVSGLPNGSLFPLGTTAVTYVVEDHFLHLTASCTFNVTVSDVEPPQVVCPSNISTVADPGVCSAVINYLPTYTDNCGVQNVTAIGGSSGSAFSTGTTEVFVNVTDYAGLSQSCSFSVGVRDNEAPLLQCPASTTISTATSVCISDSFVPTPVAYSDNCRSFIFRYIPPGIVNDRYPIGTFTYSFGNLDDLNGGILTVCSFQLTVEDLVSPIINCPANIQKRNDAGQCGSIATYTTVNAWDNCNLSSTVQTSGGANGSFFAVGTSVQTFVASDIYNNNASCSFSVQVSDQDAPTITCPVDMTVSNDAGVCSAAVTFGGASVADNCAGATAGQVSGQASGAVFSVGAHTVGFRATDLAGSTASCSTSIVVRDTEVPQITCPSAASVNTDPGICGAMFSYSVPVSDNCGSVTLVRVGPSSGSVFSTGSTGLSFNVTDGVGLSSGCSSTVTVTDNERPTIQCPGNVVVGNDAGQCGAQVTYGLATAQDNCGVTSLVVTTSIAQGGVFPVGVSSVTYQASDAAGNTASCSFSVTVEDREAPVIHCDANKTQSTDAGVCGATVQYSNATSTDNCGSTVQRTVGASAVSGSVFSVGATEIGFQAHDLAGNSAVCSTFVTIDDQTDPVVTCPEDMTVNRSVGLCTGQVTFTTPVGTDACAATTARTRRSSIWGSGNTTVVLNIGSTQLEYTSQDASGNIGSCHFTITVLDNNNPHITCPADVVQNNDAGLCSALVQYSAPQTDDCVVSTLGSLTAIGSGNAFSVGAHTEIYQVVNSLNASATCSFEVTVVDAEAPKITCPASVVLNSDAGQCYATLTYSAPVGTDNCVAGLSTRLTSGAGVGGRVNVSQHSVESYSVQDGAWLTASCNFTVDVVDREVPSIVCPGDIVANTDFGRCGASITYNSPVTGDNCGTVSLNRTSGLASGSEFGVGNTTVTFVATDGSGNTGWCSFVVTVVDEESPVLLCPGNISHGTDASMCSAMVTFSVSHSDNCAGSVRTLTAGLSSGSVFPLGSTAEGYTVVDVSGNMASCQFEVAVSDSESPVVVCPSNIENNNDAGQCQAVVGFTAPVGTDNCPGAQTTLSSVKGPGATYAVGTTGVSYTVTDSAGHATQCTFSVRVNDAELPTIGNFVGCICVCV